MVGKYEIEIYNKRVHYSLEIKRNITVIQGNSATGKSTLIEMISDYERLGTGSGIVLKCKTECSVLNTNDWRHYIKTANNKIIFVDENAPFIKTKEFAEAIQGSDNYFVLIYRDSLPQLSYSIDEIYGIRVSRDSQKYVNAKKVYNELYCLYYLPQNETITPDIIVTEDSNSGYEMFSHIFGYTCITAGGKSRISNLLMNISNRYESILVIVDGAAFGADMQKYANTASGMNKKIVLYAPESFEYILLQSEIIKADKDMLERTYNFADSTEYISWEDFYTKYIVNITKNSVFRYSKSKLNDAYLLEKNVYKFISILPKQIVLPESRNVDEGEKN